MNGPNVTDATDSPREMNWKLLRPYESGLQVVGWAAMAFYAVVNVSILHLYYSYISNRFGPEVEPAWARLLAPFALCAKELDLTQMFLLPGLALLILAQLIRCLAVRKYSPGRMLRHGHWVLFLYGAILLVQISWGGGRLEGHHTEKDIASFALSTVAPTVMKAMLVLGAALILRRLVSIVEESKTLV